MKYLKLFENEDELIPSFNLPELLKSNDIYALYGKDKDDEAYAKITYGDLKLCLEYYKLNKKGKNSFEETIIIKTSISKELLTEDDIEMMITAKKYNL